MTSIILDDVTVSVVEKRYVVFCEFPTHIKPARKVKKRGVLSFVVPTLISSNFIVATAAV